MGGGGGLLRKVVTGVATGGIGTVLEEGMKAISPKIPKLPDPVDPAKTALGLQNAKNAVLSKEAEERRARAAKRQQTVLTGGLGLQGSSPTATATLTPTEARKSVLG